MITKLPIAEVFGDLDEARAEITRLQDKVARLKEERNSVLQRGANLDAQLLDAYARGRIHAIEQEAGVRSCYEQSAKAALAGTSALSSGFDLISHLRRQRKFSERTFGPGARAASVVNHIRKELIEVEADPSDIREWVDVIILAFDGAWRAGWEPEAIVDAIATKQAENESRTWPDWRTVQVDKIIEHDRTLNAPPADQCADARREALEEVELWAAELSSITDPDSGEDFNKGWEEALTETARHCRALITPAKGGE